jgi:serine/threonine protein kinase
MNDELKKNPISPAVLPKGSVLGNSKDSDSFVPQTLGKCKVEEIIGSGGMGYVFKGKHLTLNIPVAIKILRREYSSIQNFSDRFVREAQVAAKLNHQNITRVYDCGCENDCLYLVMEYVDGGSLADMLERRQFALEPEKVVEIGIAVAHALVEAEKYHIIHRDIKPANIMMTSDGVIKLADLGLAKQISLPSGKSYTLTMDIMALGTPVYMPPEQARDAKNCDIRSDIYALGITLYHLVTGQPPFMADNTTDIFSLHANSNAQSLRELNSAAPKELEHIITKCIKKAPEDRYQSPKELVEDLMLLKMNRPLKYAAPLSAKPQKAGQDKIAGEPEKTAKTFRGKAVLISGVFVFLVSLLLLGVVLFFKSRRTEEPSLPDFPSIEKDGEESAEAELHQAEVDKKPEYLQIPKIKDIPLPPPLTDEAVRNSGHAQQAEKQKHEGSADNTPAPKEIKTASGEETGRAKEKIAVPPKDIPAEIILSESERKEYEQITLTLQNIPQKMRFLAYDRSLEHILGSLLFGYPFDTWEQRANKIADIMRDDLPSEMTDFLDALDFACSFADSLDDATVKNSFDKRLDAFNKRNFEASFIYTPDRKKRIEEELSGNIKDDGKNYLLTHNDPIRFKIPFLFHPESGETPKEFNVIVNKIPRDAGVALKWSFNTEPERREGAPPHILIYFVLQRKDGKDFARIMLNGEKLKEQKLESKILDAPFFLETKVAQDGKIEMSIGESIEIKTDMDERFLSNPEMAFMDIIPSGNDIQVGKVELIGQVFPYWMAIQITNRNPGKRLDFFKKWVKE